MWQSREWVNFLFGRFEVLRILRKPYICSFSHEVMCLHIYSTPKKINPLWFSKKIKLGNFEQAKYMPPWNTFAAKAVIFTLASHKIKGTSIVSRTQIYVLCNIQPPKGNTSPRNALRQVWHSIQRNSLCGTIWKQIETPGCKWKISPLSSRACNMLRRVNASASHLCKLQERMKFISIQDRFYMNSFMLQKRSLDHIIF